ncbi:MAG: EI24 domain-containing protein [Verrucomicrobiota bacterium]
MPAPKKNYLHGILSGLRAYLSVPGTVRKYRLGHYLLAPAALSFLLSLAILAIVIFSAIGLSQYVDRAVDIPIRWLDETVNWIAGILGAFAMLAVFVFLHKRIVLIVLAPFLARLSELTVRGLEGDHFNIKLDFKTAFKRGLYINTRSIFLELSATLSLLAIGFLFPPVAIFTATLVFLIESRFVGFGLVDFPLEYKGFSVQESITYAKSHRALATGLGAGYFLLLAIPIVGWMIAPTFGTVAGTLRAMEDLKESETSPQKYSE